MATPLPCTSDAAALHALSSGVVELVLRGAASNVALNAATSFPLHTIAACTPLVSDSGVRALVAGVHAHLLMRVSLDNSHVTAAGVCALLLAAPALSSLSLARVGRVNWFDLLSALARPRAPASRLAELSLRDNAMLVDAAVDRLRGGREGSPSPLASLVAIDVSDCSALTGAGLLAFARTAPTLRVILARRVRVSADQLRALSSTPTCSELRVLSLPHALELDTHDTRAAWSALCAVAQALVVLDVRGARGFGEDAAAKVSALLRVLDARGTALQAHGLLFLRSQQLASVSLSSSGAVGRAGQLEPWRVADAAAAVSSATATALRAAAAKSSGRVRVAVKRLGEALDAARALNFVLQCGEDSGADGADSSASVLTALADSRQWWTTAAAAAWTALAVGTTAASRTPQQRAAALAADDAVAAGARVAELCDDAARALQRWWPRARRRFAARVGDRERARGVFAILAALVLARRSSRECTHVRAVARERIAVRLSLAWRARCARGVLSRLRAEYACDTAACIARTRARAVCARFIYGACLASRAALTRHACAAASVSRARVAALRVIATRAIARAIGAAAAAIAAQRGAAAASCRARAAGAALQLYRHSMRLQEAADAARLTAARGRSAVMLAVRVGEMARVQRRRAETRIARAFDTALRRRRNAHRASRELAFARAKIRVAVSLQAALRGNAARARTRGLVCSARLAATNAHDAADSASRLIASAWREARDARAAHAQQWCWFIDGQSGHVVWARRDGRDAPRWRPPPAVRALLAWPPACACGARPSVECAECWRVLCAHCCGVAHAAGAAESHARRALRDAGIGGDGEWPPRWCSDAAADEAANAARRGKGRLSRLQFVS